MERNDISDDVATLGITFDHNGNIIKVKDKVKIDDKKIWADHAVNEDMTSTVRNPLGYQTNKKLKNALARRDTTVNGNKGAYSDKTTISNLNDSN